MKKKQILIISFFVLIWTSSVAQNIITTDIQYDSNEQTLELTVLNPTDYTVYIISPAYNDVHKNTIWYTAFDYSGNQIYKYYSMAITDENGAIQPLLPIAPKSSINTKHHVKNLLQDKFPITKILSVECYLRYGSEDPILMQQKKNIGTVVIKQEFELLKN